MFINGAKSKKEISVSHEGASQKPGQPWLHDPLLVSWNRDELNDAEMESGSALIRAITALEGPPQSVTYLHKRC